MKKVLSVIICIVLCIVIASAHPGDTDANGGHYDHSAGEYHYHHGYPAHQHTGGTCPYDYDDRTGQNSGSPNNSGKRQDGVNEQTITKEKTLWEKVKNTLGNVFFWLIMIPCALLTLFQIWIIIRVIFSSIKDAINSKKK